MPIEKSHKYDGKDLEAMSFAENYHRWILEEFLPYLSGDVVEVGAGSGNFTRQLAEAHVNCLTSYEPSKEMYSLLKQVVSNFGHVTAINGFFDDTVCDNKNCYDTIVYVNVLEHIEDDLSELKFVFNALRPGGNLCVFVPALSWLYSDLDKQVGHYRRYHKNELKGLAMRAGFEIEKIKYFDMLGIIPWYVIFVLLKKTISGGEVSVYDKMVVPLIKKGEAMINPPVGKNLLLVCKKPG